MGWFRKRIGYLATMALTWIAPTAIAATGVVLVTLNDTPSGKASTLGAALAKEYAPTLRFDSDEKFKPVSRLPYVGSSGLWALYERKNGHDLRQRLFAHMTYGRLPAQALACPAVKPPFDECNYYLEVAGIKIRQGVSAFQRFQKRVLAEAPKPTVYWYYDEKDAVLQFWFFYVFNAFLNWHEGDWEQVTIAFDPSNQTPERIGYSSHGHGQFKYWADLKPGAQIVDDSPVVYVARGSHANYFRTGLHPVPECYYKCSDRSDGKQKPFRPADYVLVPLTPPSYSGDYSSGNYLKFGVKRLGSGINVEDPINPRRKSPLAWLDLAAPADDGLTSSGNQSN